jgi:hypothetical protein
MTISTDIRAERAENALRSYVEAKSEVFENDRSEIVDLIADLLHLLARDHIPQEVVMPWQEDVIQSTLDLAQMHFEAERCEEEDED